MPSPVSVALVENLPDIIERDGSRRLNMSREIIMDEILSTGEREGGASDGGMGRTRS
jgi:hypothetical protein